MIMSRGLRMLLVMLIMVFNRAEFFMSLRPISVELNAERRPLKRTTNTVIPHQWSELRPSYDRSRKKSEKINPMNKIMVDVKALNVQACLIIDASLFDPSFISLAENIVKAGLIPKSVNSSRKLGTTRLRE
jgi:hypothetical protein